jgi:hypothetical protein
MSYPIFFPILVFSFLVGCVSNRPLVLDADNAASPTAREAISPPAEPILDTDPLSKRTRELIAARAAQETQVQVQQQDKEMKDMPEMQHREDGQSQHH